MQKLKIRNKQAFCRYIIWLFQVNHIIFAANFLDKPKTKAVNNGLIGLVI